MRRQEGSSFRKEAVDSCAPWSFEAVLSMKGQCRLDPWNSTPERERQIAFAILLD
jgi:hypothetical protein